MELPPSLGGLGIKVMKNVAIQEYENSRKMTKNLANQILSNISHNNDENKTKQEIKNQRNKFHKEQLENLRSKMNDNEND